MGIASWRHDDCLLGPQKLTDCDNFPYKNLAVLDYCDHEGSDPVFLSVVKMVDAAFAVILLGK